MQTRLLTRHASATQNPGLFVSVLPSAVLPRRISPGIFFVSPSRGVSDNDSGNGNGDDTSDALPSTNTLAHLGITHAVVQRGTEFESDYRFRCGTTIKALFVGPHDPLSRVVAWMCAVRRRLNANLIVVGDFAAAAGYLVVEQGLTPRSAWLRIARGVPPAGDLVLARLCALAIVHHEKEKEGKWDGSAAGTRGSSSDPGRGSLLDVGAGGHVSGPRAECKYGQFGVSPRSCRSARFRKRAESGLKHVVVISSL